MSDDEEFTVAVGRRYTQEHLWFQLISSPNDEQAEYKVGISDFIRVEFGRIIRATLPNMRQKKRRLLPHRQMMMKISNSELVNFLLMTILSAFDVNWRL